MTGVRERSQQRGNLKDNGYKRTPRFPQNIPDSKLYDSLHLNHLRYLLNVNCQRYLIVSSVRRRFSML
ncbi:MULTISPECIES: hypothetical protein [Photorhabdus]|uniref:hypothetical protein n=1 Tax=Photorhabdus TaxID=29487 RepID=UPI000312C93E|nr:MULTISPECIES: hypothetical protein [Photorhabdus]NDK97159.1 hypothetical protein [Photorhabdus laumondii subsp. laumondii]NDL49911.1 hypothetical protein [Photorhabdus laumondii subsp. laumondii]